MNEDKKKQQILEKLRKLMDLKNSAELCGEIGEAHAAAAGITRLLREYDLTLQDIPQEQKEKDPMALEQIPSTYNYIQYQWYWTLLDVIARHNNAEIVRTREINGFGKVESTVYSVVGRKKNREVVQYLVSFLCHQFLHIGKKKYREYKLNHIRTTGRTPVAIGVYMKNFLLGCAVGLHDKLEEEKKAMENEKITAMVLSNKKDIDNFLADMNVREHSSRKIKAVAEIVEEGVDTGRNIQIHKGIGEEKKRVHSLQ